jgi:hypothetical protein
VEWYRDERYKNVNWRRYHLLTFNRLHSDDDVYVLCQSPAAEAQNYLDEVAISLKKLTMKTGKVLTKGAEFAA